MDRAALNDLEVRANPNSCDEVIMLLEKGKVDFKPLMTHTFPLTEFEKALSIGLVSNWPDVSLELMLSFHAFTG